MKPIIKLNSRSLFLVLITGLFLVLGLALLPLARAADVTAGSAAELTTAINTVNAAGPGNHSISLTADITLSAPLPALANTAASNIRIDGGGHTLNANATGTALAVLRGVNATVEEITITNGDGSSGPDKQSGGAIFNLGTLAVIDSTLTNNTATNGAGIYNAGGEDGGTAALTLTRVTLTNNEATSTGGALTNIGANSAATVTITDSVINDNSATSYGGAIANNGLVGEGTITIHNTTLAGNESSLGGAIINNGNNGDATVTVTRSTLSGNTATDSGGAIFIIGNLGTAEVDITNSTLSGNSTPKSGGAITTAGSSGSAALAMRFVTLADNSAATGGSLYTSSNGVVEMVGTIVAIGSKGAACAFNGGTAITSGGYNLDTDGSCGLSATGDISDGEAGLAALAVNAPGTTATHALTGGSAALQQVPDGVAGCGTTVTTDQRGVTRPSPAPLCDMGAYESSEGGGEVTPTPTATATTPPEVTPTATVPGEETPPAATATATATGTPPPPDCTPPYAPTTEQQLNDAIFCVNEAGAGTHTITLAGDISLSRTTRPLDNGDGQIVIDGAGHTINGQYKGTILSVTPGTSAHVLNIKLINGQGNQGTDGKWAGAIYNQGDLTVENSTLSGNLSDRGGAIANHGSGADARLTVRNATLSGNAAMLTGGGIFNMAVAGGSATVEVVNSTFSGNLANSGGGGLYNASTGGNATADLRYVTMGLNASTNGGSAIHTAQTGATSAVTLTATILTDGMATGANCSATSGAIISGGYNLSADASCSLTQGSDLPSTNPLLQSLALNAPGTTATFALGENSPALGRIPTGQAGCGTTVAADQRGAPRPMPAAEGCDIGAYERQLGKDAPEPTPTPQPSDDDFMLLLPVVMR